MSRDSLTQDESAPQSEADRSFWHYRYKFPRKVEAAFQAEMDRMRERRIYKTGLTAVLLYSAFALTDPAMVPDAYQQAWAIRFLVVVPFLLLTTWFVYTLRRPFAREMLLSAALIVSGISMPWIAGLSRHPNAAHFQTGITLILLFGNIVLNLRFRSALITSLLMALMYGLTLTRFGALTPEVRFNNLLFCLAAVAISLIANFRMDQDQRRAYLARMREIERNDELSHAVELLAKISAEDGMTQIANRREFDRRLHLEWSRARRESKPVAIVIADVDFFKNYNDHYGHPAGDDCLKRIAAALRSVPKRPTDLVARFGGEEFAALLPGVAAEDAAAIAERMRQAIVDLQIPHAASRIGPGVTVSFGVAAMLPVAHEQPAELIAAADAALYRAKEQGRNRVSVYEEDQTVPMVRADY
ncbi:diguanylate cyclase [Noviherbaspirillum sp.]|uniref:GGDEF domain-containing protein n=1 Tax=Noviherbaspirillum sp. TaxID=1926288 RepID=UPI002B46CFEA|nr:diguanylate cyclase [Noviherbaspirillum sp.]HJV80649.1 diguanylate cyclase [Noviherbaspirillum sp.]